MSKPQKGKEVSGSDAKAAAAASKIAKHKKDLVAKGKDSGAFKEESAPANASAADAKAAVDKNNEEVDEEVEAVMKSVAESINQLKLKGDSEDAKKLGLGSVPGLESSKKSQADAKADDTADLDESTLKKRVLDVRVAVVGNVDSGKSTLIGVLTGGTLDNGRGLARSRVFVHAHELANGRTSCISQHILGFDGDAKVVHQPVAASASAAAKTKSWKEVVSASKSLVTFIDLAGHEKYLKTTIAGLTGCFPDYATIIINSLAGVTKMTKEHLGVCLALEIPLCCVVTKVDMCPVNVLKRTKQQLFRILKSQAAKCKMPVAIRDSKDVATCIGDLSGRIVPVFFVSSVTGTNLPLLLEYLSALKPRRNWSGKKGPVDGLGLFKDKEKEKESKEKEAKAAVTDIKEGKEIKEKTFLQDQEALDKAPTEFNIDETFLVTGVGIVISGTVTSGTLRTNQTLMLGPHSDNTWKEVFIRSIHCKRVPVEECHAGDSCAVSLRPVKRKDLIVRQQIRRGMVLVDASINPRAVRAFMAEVHVLHHPTTIKNHYQAVIHCGIIRQTAAIEEINRECLRTGDNAVCKFRFMMRSEYLHEGMTFIFREGNTKGIGRVTKLLSTDEDEKLAADAAAATTSSTAAAGDNKEADDEAPSSTTSSTGAAAAAPAAGPTATASTGSVIPSSKNSGAGSIPSNNSSKPAASIP